MTIFIYTVFGILILILLLLIFKFKSINDHYKKLLDEKKHLETVILDFIPKPIIIINIHEICTNINKEFEELFGTEKDALINRQIKVINNDKLQKVFDTLSRELKSMQNYGITASVSKETYLKIRSRDFNVQNLKIYKSYLYDNEKNLSGLIGIIEDVTDHEKKVNKLIKDAIYDELTQIYNRNYFNKVIKEEIERANRYKTKLSLVIFDIDFFKKVNDTYGHDIGDYVLKTTAYEVSRTKRTTDKFFRVGGEEFALILLNTDLESSYTVAEKLRKSVEDLSLEKVGGITISVGIAAIKEQDTFETLYKRADEALYKAKNGGRNRVESKE